jgi:predicted small secreted protein
VPERIVNKANMRPSHACICILLASALVLSSCEFDNTPTGPTRETSIHIDKGNAERANIDLNMGAGQLNVRGNASKLIDGTFEFNVPSWEPKVDTSNNGSSQTVRIDQPKSAHLGGKTHYVWDLELNNDVALDLNINCGAGQARLDLGDLNLRDVQVHMGAGQVDLDLRGKPKRDYEVQINGGVGQASVRLPEEVGIWAEAHGGLGSITVSGLDKKDNHWENSLYGKAKANLRLKVEGGIGEIRIIG